MIKVTYKKKKPEERDLGFCRINYLRAAGSTRHHLSMEADKPEGALRGIAVMLTEYAIRAGESIDDANYELLKECDRIEKEGREI